MRLDIFAFWVSRTREARHSLEEVDACRTFDARQESERLNMSYNGPPPPPPPYGYTPNMPPQVSGDRPPLAPLKKSAFTRSDWTALLTRRRRDVLVARAPRPARSDPPESIVLGLLNRFHR